MNRLEQTVLEIIGENTSSPDVFTDDDTGMAPIRDSLNDAIQEIVTLTGLKISTYPLPLRQAQMFYRFSLNTGYFGWVVGAWSVNRRRRLEQTDLVRLNAYDTRWMNASGEPRSYFQIGLDVLGVYPKPGSTSNILELKIVEIPKAYTSDTARVNLRADFEYAAINYAVAEYWAGRGDANSATDYFGKYLAALGLDEGLRNRDRIPRLRTEKENWPRDTA